MVSFILLVVLDIVLWWLVSWCGKNDHSMAEGFSVFFAGLDAFAILSISIWLCTKGDDARNLGKDRVYYQECVYSLNDRMSFETVDRIMTHASSINHRIEVNKANADNTFYGIFYNKRIGAIEPIVIPELRVSTSIYKKEKEE